MCFYIIFYITTTRSLPRSGSQVEKTIAMVCAFLLRNISHIFTCTHIKYMDNQQ